MKSRMSYKQAGVDIDTADAAKAAMAKSLETTDARVLNKIGAFASLFDARFPGYKHPVLVLKTEEPGSKQKIAFQHGRVESICQDMINHLINDIIVMGARPLSVQDAVICGKLDKPVVNRIVDALACACREQDCVLTGGETSEQPGVLEPGLYILTSSIVGVVEKDKILDGSKIAEGDMVISAASSGLHTNGYSLVRALIARKPGILNMQVDGESFLDAILRPHKCYWQDFRELFDMEGLHGLAHITGGGIGGNLNRILPSRLNAAIDLAELRPQNVFKLIREQGGVDDADMLRTFNLGAGMTIVAAPSATQAIRKHLSRRGVETLLIGQIVPGEKKVVFSNRLKW